MATPFQMSSLNLVRETRSSNPFLESIPDAKAIQSLKELELMYWNEWEAACRFQDTMKQQTCMHRISAINDCIIAIREDMLGR